MEKIRIDLPIIVEGKYDKNTVSQIVDGTVIATGGFSVFNNRERQALIRRLAERDGVIVLTDPDAGGGQIRRFLRGILPPEKIRNVYVPRVAGKERRKAHPSKEGVLGVEGLPADTLRRALAPFASGAERRSGTPVTKTGMYIDGLSGGENASARRAALAAELGLPQDMSAASLLEAINLLGGEEIYRPALARLHGHMSEKEQ